MSDLREQLKELDERATKRVTTREWCSCALMQWPKCNLCDADSKVEHVDWEATALALEAYNTALRNALPEILAALASRDEIRREALREAADVCREMTRYGCVGPEGDYAAGMEVGAGDYIDAESTADAILALAEKEGA